MNSKERHEARRQRRIKKREAKRAAFAWQYDDFDKVFTYGNLYEAYRLCTCGVRWKGSIQRNLMFSPVETYKMWKRLMLGKFTHDPFYEFDLYERGHLRHIRSVTVRERGVQRCLSDHALVPLVTRSFVYDNGASMKDKGYTFAIRRIEAHLHRHFRKYGNEGYILLFDFKRFFDNVCHKVIFDVVDKSVRDERLNWLTKHFVSAFGDAGLGLGSQISQVLALASANRLDHYIKEVCRVGKSARYMDDGYLIHHDKSFLEKCLEGIKMICNKIGIVMNVKKTCIVKLSHGFTFLKARFFLTKTGKVVKKIYKRSVVIERRKLKRLRSRVNDGLMTPQDVFQSFQSWRSYARTFDAFHTICNMEKLVRDLFPVEQCNFQWFSKTEIKKKRKNLRLRMIAEAA